MRKISIDKSKVLINKESAREKAVLLMRKVTGYKQNCDFDFSLDYNLYEMHGVEPIIWMTQSDRFKDVGILKGDILIVNPEIKDVAENDGLIVSVVSNDKDFHDYLDITMWSGFGSDDILDVEFVYEGDKKPKRKRKGDAPEIKREIIGLVTHIIRNVAKNRGTNA